MAKFYLLKSLAGGTVWLNRDMITDIFVPDEKQKICIDPKHKRYEDRYAACYSLVSSENGETAGITTTHDTLEAAQAEAKMIAMGHDQV